MVHFGHLFLLSAAPFLSEFGPVVHLCWAVQPGPALVEVVEDHRRLQEAVEEEEEEEEEAFQMKVVWGFANRPVDFSDRRIYIATTRKTSCCQAPRALPRCSLS